MAKAKAKKVARKRSTKSTKKGLTPAAGLWFSAVTGDCADYKEVEVGRIGGDDLEGGLYLETNSQHICLDDTNNYSYLTVHETKKEATAASKEIPVRRLNNSIGGFNAWIDFGQQTISFGCDAVVVSFKEAEKISKQLLDYTIARKGVEELEDSIKNSVPNIKDHLSFEYIEQDEVTGFLKALSNGKKSRRKN